MNGSAIISNFYYCVQAIVAYLLAGLSGIGMRDDRCYDAVDGSDRRHRKSDKKSGYNTLSRWGEQPRKSNSRLPSCDLVLSLVCVCFTINVEICHTYPTFRPIWDLSRGMFELTDPPIHEFFLLRTRDTILFH